MIGSLQGKIMEFYSDSVLMDVHGVGYEVSCSVNTLEDIKQMELTKLWIHTHVREDALSLFGFSSKTEKHLFLSLIKVNGVGPKMALSILSGAHLDKLIGMIEAGDVKGLTALPKVGKKTAEQLILSLKGHLVTEDEKKPQVVLSVNHSKIVSALVNLGFRLSDAQEAVAELPADINMEEGVRQCLSLLSGSI